ncbi:MAG TPA: maleylacetate reductase [Nocardioidaceae bacterium]|nr:maleylacetate reductase [Nocardioidaceae bacterium]
MKSHQPGGGATQRDRFDFEMRAQRVVLGAGRVRDVPEELSSLGVGRAILIASRSAKRAADDLAGALGPVIVARIHEVVQHVPEREVATALDLVATTSPEGLVTIGGGSAIGLGKAIAVEAGLPLLVVPTTYSGSEATSIYGITGEHKRTRRDPAALPRVVVYDPALTTSMPATVTATSGLNAVAHSVEALYSPGANPLTDLFATESIRLLAGALPVAVTRPDDLSARVDALQAAYLAGWSTATAGTALHHTLCHVIGGTHHLGHSELHAVLLPYVAGYNAPAAPEAMVTVAAALGTSDAPGGLRRLAERLEAPTALAALGLPHSALDDIVARAITAVGERNPRAPDATSLRWMLEDAYAGRPPGHY